MAAPELAILITLAAAALLALAALKCVALRVEQLLAIEELRVECDQLRAAYQARIDAARNRRRNQAPPQSVLDAPFAADDVADVTSLEAEYAQAA